PFCDSGICKRTARSAVNTTGSLRRSTRTSSGQRPSEPSSTAGCPAKSKDSPTPTTAGSWRRCCPAIPPSNCSHSTPPTSSAKRPPNIRSLFWHRPRIKINRARRERTPPLQRPLLRCDLLRPALRRPNLDVHHTSSAPPPMIGTGSRESRWKVNQRGGIDTRRRKTITPHSSRLRWPHHQTSLPALLTRQHVSTRKSPTTYSPC